LEKEFLPIRSTRAIQQKSFAKTPVAKQASADSSTGGSGLFPQKRPDGKHFAPTLHWAGRQRLRG
jgi:hypothetical protein